jgi:hypothetical protein
MSFIWFLLNNAYPIAAELGLIFGVVHFGWALWVFAAGIPLFTPQDYYEVQVEANPPGPDGIGPDRAWPLYTVRQAAIDRAAVRRNLSRLVKKLWSWPVATWIRGKHGSRWAWWIIGGPVAICVFFFVIASFLSSWFCYWVYWAVIFAFQFTDRTLIAAFRARLRTREDQRRAAMYTDAACMNCLHVTPWPTYVCPTCDNRHNDVMPGTLGTLTRTCECGTAFPTLPSRTAWHLQAACKRCKEALPQGAGAVRDIRIPVFGDTYAGKTRFLFAALNSLLAGTEQAGIRTEFLDDRSRDEAERNLAIIRDGRDTDKTGVNDAVAISLRLRERKEADFIHLFDAAGEQYRDASRYDDLRFLEDGQALVYVLDPFSIDAIRGRLGASSAEVLAAAHAAEQNTEIAYGEVVNRLHVASVPTQRQRLAIVVSKADLLREAGIAVPSDSQQIADWLTDEGLYNLVTAASREFKDVTYFTVASQAAATGHADDPGAPLRWLLAAHGVKVPGGAAAPTGSGPIKPLAEVQ